MCAGKLQLSVCEAQTMGESLKLSHVLRIRWRYGIEKDHPGVTEKGDMLDCKRIREQSHPDTLDSIWNVTEDSSSLSGQGSSSQNVECNSQGIVDR